MGAKICLLAVSSCTPLFLVCVSHAETILWNMPLPSPSKESDFWSDNFLYTFYHLGRLGKGRK